MNCTTLRSQIEKKRQEMIRLTKHYMLTSPEIICVSQELDRLLNMLQKKECCVEGNIA
ncbi:aspartyl-phosphate phosphatase Spo0E family protein [Bacillus paramycoides]|nr:aspartyl-phosphate phosphatase Spo0E family protein [Bacillus paramycoides]